MDSNFDLTTQHGYKSALKTFKNLFWLISPIGWLIMKSLDVDNNTEKQVELAIKLIKSGKENGLKSLRIKISNKAGFKIGTNIEGIPLNIGLQNDEYMELIIVYK